MKKGSSIKWSKVLEDLTDGRSNKLDPLSMLEYFKPLHKWLLKQNLKLSDWDCDKYLDIKNNRVRAYDEEIFSANEAESFDINSFEVNRAKNKQVSLILFWFSFEFFLFIKYVI